MRLLALFVSCLALLAGGVEARHVHRGVRLTPALADAAVAAPGDACTTPTGITGICSTVSDCISAPLSTAINTTDCPAPTSCCIKQAEDQPGCGSAALQRAGLWAAAQLHYCQSPNNSPDTWDPDCPAECIRASNAEWDPYRSDCSGLVSFAYGVPAPGRTTRDYAPYSTDISFLLATPLQLQAGDPINSTPREHIMLFREWLNDDHMEASFMEEPGCAASIPYAKRTDTNVTINADGTLTLAVNGMTFFPIRFFSNQAGECSKAEHTLSSSELRTSYLCSDLISMLARSPGGSYGTHDDSPAPLASSSSAAVAQESNGALERMRAGSWEENADDAASSSPRAPSGASSPLHFNLISDGSGATGASPRGSPLSASSSPPTATAPLLDFPATPLPPTPPPEHEADDEDADAAHSKDQSSFCQRLSFYLFLLVFYIGSKGLSQLFASFVSSSTKGLGFKAPIFLTSCEYGIWVLLGSIHSFTVEEEPAPERKRTTARTQKHSSTSSKGATSPTQRNGVGGGSVKADMHESLLSGAAHLPGDTPEEMQAHAAARDAASRTGALSCCRSILRLVKPSAAPVHATTLEMSRPPCECHCDCERCIRAAPIKTRYPSAYVTASYLGGELVKTVLEVSTVTSVELSLALVLLATAPLFSILFRGVLERRVPSLVEVVIVLLVSLGLVCRIPEIRSAPVGGVVGGLVSAAAAAWISSFKSLIFDPRDAPHVLLFMSKFGPALLIVSSVACGISEHSVLASSFSSTESFVRCLSVGMLFGLLAAPSSVVSKRLQRLLGSFQRTLLGVLNNVLVALVSATVLADSAPPALAVAGSMLVFLSPAVNFLPINKAGEHMAAGARRAWRACTTTSRRRAGAQRHVPEDIPF